MKNVLIFKVNILIWFLALAHQSVPTNVGAVEKIHFCTSDETNFWCDRDNLKFCWDKEGELARICNPIDNENFGKSRSTPVELDSNGRLWKEYILDLIRDGEVSFKDKADAENSLRICEKYGLTGPEDFIRRYLKKPKRKTTQNESAMAVDTQISRTQYRIGDCPEGYVLVPGNDSYNTPGRGEDFCLMKYTASEENGRAVSRTGLTPKVRIERAGAATACRANGEGYHLITNDEWMTTARDIEANPENWSGRAVGEGYLYRGHSNGNAALAAGSDDNPYFGTGSTGGINRRTHTLSSGEVIWDMAGNVWQWVADNLTTQRLEWKEFSDLGTFPLESEIRSLYGPRGTYDSNQGMGKIYMYDAGAVIRGGAWDDDTDAGVFAAVLNDSASYTGDGIGFRCAVAAGAR